MIEFELNGEKKHFSGDPEMTLLHYLRDQEGLTAVKDGCSGQGNCGCCTVEVNSKATLSCITPMKKIAQHRIITPEGLKSPYRDAFARAFTDKGGVQCGYCTPGIVMRTNTLLKTNSDPSREEITKSLQSHLCRCTGYKKIIDSVIEAGKLIREQKPIPRKKDTPSVSAKVGTRLSKFEAEETVLGERPFVGDMKAEGMLFSALKFSDHPRAVVKKIDTREAARHPGVLRVVTEKDIPGERIIGLIINDWPLMVAEGETTRYLGDVLVGVIAQTDEAARQAVAKIKVEYEILKPLGEPSEALDPNAPKIHASGNVLSVSEIKFGGDIEAALKASAYVVNRKYTTQRIEHAFMEVESCFVKPWKTPTGEKGLEVFSQGQGAYEDRKQIARILGQPLERIKVVQVSNGGAFGGKEDLSVQGHAALHAWLMDKPVRLTWTREESMIFHPKRHPFEMEYTLGCSKDGKLTALKTRMICDTGAYASVGMKVNERAISHCNGAYTIPVVDALGRAVYTNNIPAGAMRGFGVNQAAFAVESCIDELCEKGGFDRWKFRWENALREGTPTCTGHVLRAGVGVRACLEAVKDEFYKAKFAGIAAGIKNTGIGCGMADVGRAKIVIESPTRVVIHHGWTEMGQGVHTMALQTVIEETGLDPAILDVVVSTDEDTVCGMTTSSRGTSLVGLSLIEACKNLKKDLASKALSELVGQTYRGEWSCDWTTKVGNMNPGKEIVTHYSYGYAAQVVVLDEKGKIEKVVAAHDAGKIMNPTLFEGQIEGAIHMGLGYAISEEFPMKEGRPLSTNLNKCGILRAKDMPEVQVIGIEVKDPNGPYGAKGVGEIGLVPTAAAVANALCHFDKKRRTALPLKELFLLGK